MFLSIDGKSFVTACHSQMEVPYNFYYKPGEHLVPIYDTNSHSDSNNCDKTA